MRYLIITGVSRGLGHALSTTLAADDVHLVGFGRTRGDFAGDFHSCDFTKPQLASSIIKSGLEALDLESASSITFIANAGQLGPICKAEDLDPFDIETTLSANVAGSAVAVSAFLARVKEITVPKLFAQISSGAALPDRVRGSWSIYCACKSAQEQLVRAIAVEQRHAAHPTKLININPGVMETRMQEQIRAVSPEALPEVGEFIKMKEDGRIPSPNTIAQKIAAMLQDPAQLESGKTYTLADYKD